MHMHIALKGLLIGIGLSLALIAFEYMSIKGEIAERSKRVAKRVDWDSNQRSRLRGVMTFGSLLPIGCALGAWLVWG
jgi:hypothetical protein